MQVKGLIKAVAREAKERDGILQRGVLISNESGEKWYNVVYKDKEKDYDKLFDSVYVKGNEIEAEIEGLNNLTIVTVTGKQELPSKHDGPTFDEMLIEAHKKYPNMCMHVQNTDIIQDVSIADKTGTEKKVTLAITRVRIITDRTTTEAKVVEATGDACSQNVNKEIAPSFIRMSETRGYSRALRFLLCKGVTEAELK